MSAFGWAKHVQADQLGKGLALGKPTKPITKKMLKKLPRGAKHAYKQGMYGKGKKHNK
jgi:hypothetical protein